MNSPAATSSVIARANWAEPVTKAGRRPGSRRLAGIVLERLDQLDAVVRSAIPKTTPVTSDVAAAKNTTAGSIVDGVARATAGRNSPRPPSVH